MDFVKESVSMFRDARHLRFNVGDRLRVRKTNSPENHLEGVVVMCCPEHRGYIFRFDDGREGVWRDSQLEPIPGPCERCKETDGVEWEPSRTCYDTSNLKPGEPNPNRDQALCRPCAEDHHSYWDDMWKNVEYL